MAPEVEALTQPGDEFWSYFDSTDSASYLAALDQLNGYIETEGPFDGVLAFSQGAGLAAMHIVLKSIQTPLQPPPFKCAILISCNAVYDPVMWLKHKQVSVLKPGTHGTPVKIPTAHIWGRHDVQRDECEAIRQLCREDVCVAVVHAGGHEVPRLSIANAVGNSVQAIRRVVTTATLQSGEI